MLLMLVLLLGHNGIKITCEFIYDFSGLLHNFGAKTEARVEFNRN